MLSFQVFQAGRPATEWTLRHALLRGPDGLVAPGQVRFEEGFIRCQRTGSGSTALSLQWDAGACGVLSLQTCLLPDREAPYLLSLELARHRVMLMLNKIEEWGQFDRPADDPVTRATEEARVTFMEALAVCQPDDSGGFTSGQDDMARDALEKAIGASQRLTESHSNQALTRRLSATTESGERLPPPRIGCAVQPDRFGPALHDVLSTAVDFISIPLPWSAIEPEEGVAYRFQPFDRWIEWAVRKARMPVVAGPVIDFRPERAPDWLYIWENDYETLRELVYEHLKKIVTRYRRAISQWTVVSGLHVNKNFTLSVEQLVDLTRLACLVVRKLHPKARVQVELRQPFGDYVATNQAGVPPLLYTEILFQAGVSLDSLGIVLEMGDAIPGRETHDAARIADLLDQFSEFEKPMTISAAGVPSEPPGSNDMDESVEGGYWGRPWSPEQQADWLTMCARTALARPMVTSFCWADLYDGARMSEVGDGGLINDQGQAKPALGRLGEIRSRLRQKQSLDSLAPLSGQSATGPG